MLKIYINFPCRFPSVYWFDVPVLLFCKSLSDIDLRTITLPRSILYRVFTVTNCSLTISAYLYPFITWYEILETFKDSSVWTSEFLSVITTHFHLSFMLQFKGFWFSLSFVYHESFRKTEFADTSKHKCLYKNQTFPSRCSIDSEMKSHGIYWSCCLHLKLCLRV